MTAHSVSATVLGNDGLTPVDGTVSITYNGDEHAPTATGTYKVIASFSSNDPDYLNTVVSGELDILQAVPTLKLTGGGTIKYDGQPHAVTAIQTGIDGATSVAGVVTITYNGSDSPPVNAGTYNVLATFTSADSNYADATATTTITIPDPTIPTGLTAIGASTTSIQLFLGCGGCPSTGYDVYKRRIS